MKNNIKWASNQIDIFNNVKNGDGHTIVSAVPGSGKTTTLCASLDYIPKDFLSKNKVFFTSFNSKIINEIKNKIPKGISYGTNHKLGFDIVRRNWGYQYNLGKNCVDSNNDIGYMLASEEAGIDSDNQSLKMNLIKAMDYCKITLAESDSEILDVIYNFGIDINPWDEEKFIQAVSNMLETTKYEPQICKGRSMISFADMIWLPVVHGWRGIKYNRIFIDEAQDLSPVRTTLLLSALKENGRFLACGDRFQAIFSFAGSDIESIDKLKASLIAKEMPLSVSYRCPISVIELAKEINPEISAADNAKDGLIDKIDAKDLYNITKCGDVIISRTNYPLIKAWFAYMKKGVKANMIGKDIGDKFIWRINSWKPNSLQDLINKIESWKDINIENLKARKKNYRYIKDEADSLLAFTYKADSLSEVFNRIFDFFDYDEKTQVTLLTAHKAKGLEFNRTFMLQDTFSFDDSREESNIRYVALTRTKDYLGLVDGTIPKE